MENGLTRERTKTLGMARKRRSFLALQAALAGLTYVDSKTYPPHNRSPRGSHKDATCNKVLQENSQKTPVISGLASPLLLQLKAIAGSFAHKQLWQQLTGRMFKASCADIEDLLKSLEGQELNAAYSFTKVSASPLFRIKKQKHRLKLTFTPQGRVHFPAKVLMSSYQYQLHMIWIDGAGKQMETQTIVTEWIDSRDLPGEWEMTFERPSRTGYYLLLVGVQAGRAAIPVERFAAQGIRVLTSGVV